MLNRYLLTLAAFLIASSCFAQKVLQSVTIKQNGCKGTCPMYNITINKDGSVIYEGKRYCDSIGTYKMNIGSKNAKAILIKLEKNKILSLPDSYPMKIADLPSFSYQVNTKTKEKSIIRANYGPKFLSTTKKDVEALIKKYKWIKQDVS
ncbi:MAG: hypothetical protein JNM95_02790 [Chitinophagaceae bacterium]|nr:hypothetical protein [Chitinophagaceae bacterium]